LVDVGISFVNVVDGERRDVLLLNGRAGLVVMVDED